MNDDLFAIMRYGRDLVTLARFMVNLQLSTIAFTSHERKQVHAKWTAFYFVQSSTDECKYKTVNMVIFFVKKNENTCPKGRALMNMYIVVLQTKRGNKHVSKRHSNNNDSTTTNYVLWLENMLLLLAEEGLGNSDVTKKKEHTKITDQLPSIYASRKRPIWKKTIVQLYIYKKYLFTFQLV